MEPTLVISTAIYSFFFFFVFRTGSVIVSFTIYFKNAVMPSEGISNFEAAISDGTFGTYQVGHLTLLSPGTSTFTSTPPRTSQPTGMKE